MKATNRVHESNATEGINATGLGVQLHFIESQSFKVFNPVELGLAFRVIKNTKTQRSVITFSWLRGQEQWFSSSLIYVHMFTVWLQPTATPTYRFLHLFTRHFIQI